MLKKSGILALVCAALLGCENVNSEPVYDYDPVIVQQAQYQQPPVKMPTSVVICRAKQCAPAKLSMTKEFIYNTLLHMLDSNAREKALVCTGNPNTHACTEDFISLPVTVGITPAYMYIDDVKIADVSISQQNTMALNLLLNWNVTYNGQTPTCRPSKTLLYAKNVNNIIMEDDGYSCRMTTIGTTIIKTMFAIDYIDLDYGYIGGFYSIGLSGPAFGGGSGYMILRLPKDVTIEAKDFAVSTSASGANGNYKTAAQAFDNDLPQPVAVPKTDGPVPNVDSIIKYNHPAQAYDTAKKQEEKRKEMEAKAVDFGGAKVFPLPAKSKTEEEK
ncbi:MAG: hypothetical protein IJ778_04155 [Alphaproteobacteria bacterium]|nr:hypothetical protein [Alphaproteobacteria bacterium]